ncbi:hypothetical protein Tdes44962_MAKER07084 [Teratosphaeria destructans]|uniref:Uncharacterized protein n=1 Tax=Teratosphaeria destructans TaxID=418781 RepID=A0A9W7T088_9PEZI|nr:hypothetical protein Tdes44962_MAKER07084 [Teratosphaeria destructans]
MYLSSVVTLGLFLSLGVDAKEKFRHGLKSCGIYDKCRCHDVSRSQDNYITQMACARFWNPGAPPTTYSYDPQAGTCGSDGTPESYSLDNCDFETFCRQESQDNRYFQWCW